MPPVVAAVAAYFVVSTTMAVFIIATAVVTLASVAYSAYMMASMKKPGASSDATTRLQTVRSSVQPHRVVYGECMTGGVLVYAQSHGENNKFISLVVAFTAHEVDAIKEVWLNEKLSSDIAFVKHIPAVLAEGYWAEQEPVLVDAGIGDGGYLVYPDTVWVETRAAVPAHDESWAQVTKYLGTQSQTADPLLVSLDPKPTALITKSPSSGLNDLTTSGDYSAVGMAVFTISISAVGSTDSFTWSDDLGHSGTMAMTGASQPLVNGISVKFAAKTGHSIGQIWELRAFDGAPWTAECTLTGCSYIVVTLEKSDTAFPNGLPNIKALIRGNNQIYDPATGTSGYTDNWALCVRDYLTKPYGLNAPTEDINEATAIAARNICDEMVTTTTGTQKRYTLNGSFTVDKTPVSIMNEILATAYGAITWTQGQYRIFPAAYYAPDMTFHGMNSAIPGLTESDLRAGIKVRPMPSMKDRFNTVKGTYISPETWQEVDFPPVTNALYVSEDGGEIVKDIQLSYVTDPARAQRIAKLMLEKSRQGIVVDFPAKWSAFPLAVGDTVPISVSRLGWDQKIFSVRDWKMNPDGGVDLSLQEDAAACYSWNSGEETTVDLAQNTILPDPRFAPVPTGLTVGEEQYSTVTVGAKKSRAIVTWDDMGAAQYQVDYLPPNNTIWAALPPTSNTTVTIDDVMVGTYQIRVRSMNYLGVWSDWLVVAQIMNGKPLPPANVSGFSATFAGNLIKLAWTPVNEIDLAGYEIRTGISWEAGTVLQAALMGNGYTYRPTGSGTITHWIKAFDTAGNESVTAATSAAVVPIADTPTAIVPTAQFLAIDLAITYDLTRQDTDGVEIWAATTNDRNTAVMIGVTRDGRYQHQGLNNGVTRYYWARCVTVFGQGGSFYPANVNSGVVGAALNEPTQAIKLLNGDVDNTKLTEYLAGTTSLLDIFDTHSMVFELGVVGPGITATYTDALRQTSSEMNHNNSMLTALSAAMSGLITADYNAATAYTIGQMVVYNEQTYQCILASTGNLPTNTTYWTPISGVMDLIDQISQDLDTATGEWTSTAATLRGDVDALIDPATGRVTLAETQITQNGSNITLHGSAITGPLAFVVGAVTEPGVVVESSADIDGLDIKLTNTIFDLDAANNTITLHADSIDSLTDSMSSAEILIDGNAAAIALRATKGELAAEVAILSDSINLRVTSADYNSQVNILSNAIGLKVASADYNSKILLIDEAIALRVTSATYNSQVQILSDAIDLRVTGDDLTGQVNILNDSIGLKLNATGTVGPGLSIAWQDEAHTKSIIRVQSDLFQVGDDTGAGWRNIFSVGNINGVPAVGVSGDAVIDGTLSARSLVADTAMVTFLNAREITAKYVAADWVYAGTVKAENIDVTIAKITAAQIGSLSAEVVNASGFTAQTANIGVAQVDTLRIGNNAISLSDALSGSSVTLPIGNGNSVTVITLSVYCYADSRVLVTFTSPFYFMRTGDFSAYNCIADMTLSCSNGEQVVFSAVGYPGNSVTSVKVVSPSSDGVLTFTATARNAMRQGGIYDVAGYFTAPVLSVVSLRR